MGCREVSAPGTTKVMLSLTACTPQLNFPLKMSILQYWRNDDLDDCAVY